MNSLCRRCCDMSHGPEVYSGDAYAGRQLRRRGAGLNSGDTVEIRIVGPRWMNGAEGLQPITPRTPRLWVSIHFSTLQTFNEFAAITRRNLAGAIAEARESLKRSAQAFVGTLPPGRDPEDTQTHRSVFGRGRAWHPAVRLSVFGCASGERLHPWSSSPGSSR